MRCCERGSIRCGSDHHQRHSTPQHGSPDEGTHDVDRLGNAELQTKLLQKLWRANDHVLLGPAMMVHHINTTQRVTASSRFAAIDAGIQNTDNAAKDLPVWLNSMPQSAELK